MAYTPLSKRVADAARKNAASSGDDKPFDWNTPERTRNLARQPTVAKDKGPRQMSMNEAIRELRKLARKPR